MKLFEALIVPADTSEPLVRIHFDDMAPSTWGALIGIDDDKTSVMTYREHGILVIIDDIANLREEPAMVNMRMNLLDGKLRRGGGIRLTNMLAGDMLIVGFDAVSGETDDLPPHMYDLMEEISRESVVLTRKVMEAQARLRQNGITE